MIAYLTGKQLLRTPPLLAKGVLNPWGPEDPSGVRTPFAGSALWLDREVLRDDSLSGPGNSFSSVVSG